MRDSCSGKRLGLIWRERDREKQAEKEGEREKERKREGERGKERERERVRVRHTETFLPIKIEFANVILYINPNCFPLWSTKKKILKCRNFFSPSDTYCAVLRLLPIIMVRLAISPFLFVLCLILPIFHFYWFYILFYLRQFLFWSFISSFYLSHVSSIILIVS